MSVALIDTPRALEPVLSRPPRPPARAPLEAPTTAAPAATMTPSAPVLVSIPALKVRSTLLHVGQAADGSVAVPAPGPTYDQAAWYRYSPTPGSPGPAVIVGHVDSAEGGPSVFFRLGTLRKADLIEVVRADGVTATFAVDDVRRYRKADFPSDLVYGDTPNATLRLITCGGGFDRSSGHYVDNIVVYASLLPPRPAKPPVAPTPDGRSSDEAA